MQTQEQQAQKVKVNIVDDTNKVNSGKTRADARYAAALEASVNFLNSLPEQPESRQVRRRREYKLAKAERRLTSSRDKIKNLRERRRNAKA